MRARARTFFTVVVRVHSVAHRVSQIDTKRTTTLTAPGRRRTLSRSANEYCSSMWYSFCLHRIREIMMPDLIAFDWTTMALSYYRRTAASSRHRQTNSDDALSSFTPFAIDIHTRVAADSNSGSSRQRSIE